MAAALGGTHTVTLLSYVRSLIAAYLERYIAALHTTRYTDKLFVNGNTRAHSTDSLSARGG